jgi:hypothetical protein
MELDDVGFLSGLYGYGPRSTLAREKQFLNANDFILVGCTASNEAAAAAQVKAWYCPECRKARQRWFSEHDRHE